MIHVNRLVEELKTRSGNEFYAEDNYIDRPKVGGYRSHHLILSLKAEMTSLFLTVVGSKYRLGLGFSILGLLRSKQLG